MKVTKSIKICAPKALVWSVTEEVEKWREWTPTIENIRKVSNEKLTVDSEVWIKQPGLDELKWTIVNLVEGELLSWRSKVRGMEMIATHKLTEVDGCVENTLILEVPGLMSFVLWPLLRGPLAKALEQENSGLKSYCEKRS